MDSHADVFPSTTTPEPELQRLPHSPATLERWFRDTPAILHSIDSRGRLIEVSNAWLDKFGYRREEVLGRLSIDFLTPESRDFAIREVVSEFYRTGRRENIAYQMVCKDGRVLDILLSAVLDEGDADRGPCSLAVITDVTALRAAERKLTQSEILYKGLVEGQTEFVSLATPEGVLLFVNHAYARLHDREPKDLVGTHVLDYVPAESRAAVEDQLHRACVSKHAVESENQVFMPDGESRWLSWTNRAIVDAEGRAVAIQSVGRDIDRRVKAEERLKASEARYRLLAENASDLVMLVRNDGRRAYVSPACGKLLGWSPDEMLAMTTRDMVHPDDIERVWRHLTEDKSELLTLSYRLKRKDGAYAWVEAATRRVEIAGEPPTRLLVVRAIGERIEAEHQIRESEARFRLLAENSSDIVILVQNDGKRVYVSPACHKILGWSPEEMLEMTVRDMVHPEDLTCLQSALAEERSDPLTLTYRFQRKDGGFIWVEAARQRVQIAGGPPHRLVVIRDIDQRKEAERRVRESEEAYRRLAEHSSDMVFELDRDLVRRYVSPASREILGYEPSELIGFRPNEKCHPDDVERVAAALAALLAGKVESQFVISRVQRRDGRWIWVEASSKALRDAETGEIRGIVGAVRDISLRKSIEDQLHAANSRLEILAAQDGLTGLANRRAFDAALMLEHRRAYREMKPLGLIVIDVDRFKSYNDAYGHPAGDACLKRIAGVIAHAIRRPGDLAARYGGEEFVVLLPNTDERGAAEVAERIRLDIRGLALDHAAAADGCVTISAGVSSTMARDAEATELVAWADKALYRAKQVGRDQVVNASWLPEAETCTHEVAEYAGRPETRY